MGVGSEGPEAVGVTGRERTLGIVMIVGMEAKFGGGKGSKCAEFGRFPLDRFDGQNVMIIPY